MADLTDEQKLEIVEALARMEAPSAIIAHFQSEHGLELDHKQVGRYDPQRSYYAAGDKWRTIFEVRRRTFLEDVSAVPIAHQGFRLNFLQRGVEAAARAENWPLAANLLEQAAKEMGGIYTSRRSVQISDNAPRRAAEMTSEERRAKMVEIIREAQVQLRARESNIAQVQQRTAELVGGG